MASILRALRYYQVDALRIVGVLLLLLLSIVAGLLRPWPLAVLVDFLLGHRPLPPWLVSWMPGSAQEPQRGILSLAFLAFGFHGLQAVLSAVKNYFSIAISLRGLARVRSDLVERLQQLSWRFHQKMPSGDLMYRASWDTYAFQTLFQQGFITSLTALCSLGFMVIIMIQIDVRLTAIALATAPLLLGVIRWLGPSMSERGKQAQESDSKVASRVQQTIHLLPLIQSYTREAQEHQVFNQVAEIARARRLSQHSSELRYGTAVAMVFAVGSAAILWVGGNQVIAGRLSVGQLLIFLAYLAQLHEPLSQLSHVGATLATAKAGTQRVFEVLDEPQEVPNPTTPLPMPELRSGAAATTPWEVAFCDVGFAYQPGHPVLKGVSFEARQGDVVAIIGPSGAGKSTLLHLIPRFFDPSAGVVRLAGVDVRRFSRDVLRSQVALLLQEPLLVQGTVRENIGFGRTGASETEIQNAAQLANAHSFILSLPQGYDTLIGEGAARLSVGEKQRINLARAFLKDAPILLLDEPTSALDGESEALVIQSLRSLMVGRTTFMVAHRLATLQAATKVLVLQQGRVIEYGTPQELLAAGGYFAKVKLAARDA